MRTLYSKQSYFLAVQSSGLSFSTMIYDIIKWASYWTISLMAMNLQKIKLGSSQLTRKDKMYFKSYGILHVQLWNMVTSLYL